MCMCTNVCMSLCVCVYVCVCVGQGQSQDSLSGQVVFVQSLSDLHFRIGAIEIFSYGCFETQNTCSYILYLKLEGLMTCLHRNCGLCINEFESIFDDIKRPTG